MNLKHKIEELKPANLNCNIFSIYDYDCESLQELLCLFFTKINECIKLTNGSVDLVNWLVSEGLSKEVAEKLKIWLEDGTLSKIINNEIFNELNQKIDFVYQDLSKYLHIVKPDEDLQELIDNFRGILAFNGEYVYNKQINLKSNTILSGTRNSSIVFNVNANENGFFIQGNNILLENLKVAINSNGSIPHGGKSCVVCSGDYSSSIKQTYSNVKIKNCKFSKIGENTGLGNVLGIFGGSNNFEISDLELSGGDGILCHWSGNFDELDPHTSPATVTYHPNNIKIKNIKYTGSTQAVYISGGYNIELDNVIGYNCNSVVQVFCGDYANKLAQYDQKQVLQGIKIKNIFGQNIKKGTIEINGRGFREQDPLYNTGNSVEMMTIDVDNVVSVSGADSLDSQAVVSVRWGVGKVNIKNLNTVYNTVNSPIYIYDFDGICINKSNIKSKDNNSITVLGCKNVEIKENKVESGKKVNLIRVEDFNGKISENIKIEFNDIKGGLSHISLKSCSNIDIKNNIFDDYKNNTIVINQNALNVSVNKNIFKDGGENVNTAIYNIFANGGEKIDVSENIFYKNTKNVQFNVNGYLGNFINVFNNISYGFSFKNNENNSMIYLSPSLSSNENFVYGNVGVNCNVGMLTNCKTFTVETH